MQQFYAVQATGGATTVTLSWTSNSTCRVDIMEFSGNAVTGAFDHHITATGTAALSGSTTLITTGADRLVVVEAGTDTAETTWTQASGYTLENTVSTALTGSYRLTGAKSPEPVSMSWNASAGYGLWASSFNAAS